MKFTEFKIENFKGIEDVTIKLDKSPDANIYTLVGLNESGKTTILEAINLFNPNDKDINALKIPGAVIEDKNVLIPISKRANFNGEIKLRVSLSIDEEDLRKINECANKVTQFREVKPTNKMVYYRTYQFKDSKFQRLSSRWDGFFGLLKSETDNSKYIKISETDYTQDNINLSNFCSNLIPSILYFPNFLFDFPSKIPIEINAKSTAKDKFYIELVQDILFSLGIDANIKTHLVDRIKSITDSDKRSLEQLLLQMRNKVTATVFEAWSKVFRKEIRDIKITITPNKDNEGLAYLEFGIEAPDGMYQINERSLGFRWFFTFLLFTQFRKFRKDNSQQAIFLFDEPASNLHSSAQSQLLQSFENITENSKVIYTTHSHHLINPHWLESTYVVKNEGLKLESPESYNINKTNITIEPYRDFVMKHPYNTDYFKPILDVLDYSPSRLESIPNCVFLEGKNDYYTLEYFQNVVLREKNKVNMAPSTGSGNLDTLISLYLGWGKKFLVLLDGDEEGVKQKKRYIKEFGIIIEKAVYTLEDIDANWKNGRMEELFEPAELLTFQQTAYPSSTEYNKTHFNRSIQENLIKNITFPFTQITLDNMNKILAFLKDKLNNQTL